MPRRANSPVTKSSGVEPVRYLRLSVELSDGTFTSHVNVPMDASMEEKNAAVDRWLEIMRFGLKLPGRVEISQSVMKGD